MWPFKNKVLSPKPELDDTSLGNIMLRMMLVTNSQLLEVLSHADSNNMRVGEAALSLRYCSASELEVALGIQEKMRNGQCGNAALDEMEARLERFGAGEDMLKAQIKHSVEAGKRRGDETGSWVLPFHARKLSSVK